MTAIRLMKAYTLDLSKSNEPAERLPYPQLLSIKLDGVRAGASSEGLFSNSGKYFPNTLLQKRFSMLRDLDMELVNGNPVAYNVCDVTRGVCNSHSNPVDDLIAYVFDHLDKDAVAFRSRSATAGRVVQSIGLPYVRFIEQVEVNNVDELLAFEEWALEQNFEGIMGRKPRSPYKHGRSTEIEGFFWKLKRFVDVEVRIEGFIEGTHNLNPLLTSAIGYAERSSAKAGKVPANTLGKFLIEWNGELVPCSCGTLSHKQRRYIWDNKEKFLGEWFTMRYFGYGTTNLPRQGRFHCFRDPHDETRLVLTK